MKISFKDLSLIFKNILKTELLTKNRGLKNNLKNLFYLIWIESRRVKHNYFFLILFSMFRLASTIFIGDWNLLIFSKITLQKKNCQSLTSTQTKQTFFKESLNKKSLIFPVYFIHSSPDQKSRNFYQGTSWPKIVK